MPPRRRIQFTQESIDNQLQQIHLLDSTSPTENLEQLGPIIKQIHVNRQQEAYLRTLRELVQSKDAEIERICGDNYQDFVTSVSTLFTIKSYTTNLREKITTLDGSVAQVGRGLVEKKKALLEAKKTAKNLDEAIDALQASLKVLDMINRVGTMIKGGEYWSALRSMHEIQRMIPISLSRTPLMQHIVSSLPSFRNEVKDAVTAANNHWLLDIRNVSEEVGRLAMEQMDSRTRRWRSRREKDPTLKRSRVGSIVEIVTNEKNEYNVLENDKLTVDFKPLYQCIHIYTALGALEELQKSYQADRKAQADLILAQPVNSSTLASLTQEIAGFFIVENHVLRTTEFFRSEENIEELWESVLEQFSVSVRAALAAETDIDNFVRMKESLSAFKMTLEAYSYSTTQLHSLVLIILQQYAGLLEKQFGNKLEENITSDDYQPMYVTSAGSRESIIGTVWLPKEEEEMLTKSPLPMSLPWSQSFRTCCQDIRGFVQRFYQFVEGVAQRHRDIDELLGTSLEHLLVHNISEKIDQNLNSVSTISQVAQMMINLEHFQAACPELERSVTLLRSNQSGGDVYINAIPSFNTTLSHATARVTKLITSKLDDFFDLSEYDWTPKKRENSPSMYLYELFNWLTVVVDGLGVRETYKDEAYKAALQYIADCLIDFVVGRQVTIINENALWKLTADVNFLKEELDKLQRSYLDAVFTELRTTTSIILTDKVQDYLVPSVRQASYSAVKPKRLQALLEKLAKFGASTKDPAEREKGERRRKEGESVGRLFPGESRH